MHTIHLEIQDSLYEQLVQSGVNVQEKLRELLNDMVDDGYHSIGMDEAKKRVGDAVERYKNGTMQCVSHDEMWHQIDQECKAKSAHHL
jgi:hypothetical protein